MEELTIPQYKALTMDLMYMGVPKNVFYGNIFCAITAVLQFKIFHLIPLFIFIHYFFKMLCKKDPKLFSVLKNMSLKKYYSY